MMERLLVLVCLGLFAGSVSATVITENTAYNSSTSGLDFALAQSVTTPLTGSWDHITFNFISSTGASYANGNLYLLTQEYLGTTSGLSSSTPGFLATSLSAAGGVWSFDTSVNLQAATSYWFYMDTYFDGSQQVRYSSTNPYSGGAAYQADAPMGTFSAHMNKTDYYYDMAFSLSGTEKSGLVPEPDSVALFGVGLAALIVSRRRTNTGKSGLGPAFG